MKSDPHHARSNLSSNETLAGSTSDTTGVASNTRAQNSTPSCVDVTGRETGVREGDLHEAQLAPVAAGQVEDVGGRGRSYFSSIWRMHCTAVTPA